MELLYIWGRMLKRRSCLGHAGERGADSCTEAGGPRSHGAR